VGLPENQMGNSEVGHLNMGAGRIVYQEFTRISLSIENGSFFKNEVFLRAVENVNKNGSSLHLMGLVSDGGVHSHMSHIKALIDLAKRNNVKKLYLHAFLDGRDVLPRSSLTYIKEVEEYMSLKGIGQIATISGRYYAMDRDNRWERVSRAYSNLVYRDGRSFKSSKALIEHSYDKGINDEFVVPATVDVEDEESARVKTSDSVIFFNFRPDRARELTKSFIFEEFDEFPRGKDVPRVFFVCMTQYDKTFDAPIAYLQNRITNTLGEVLSEKGLRQLRIAETEKYAHVTFFFNGGVEKPNKYEDRILIPSPKVATYDLKPEMSAFEVTDKVLEVIEDDLYDVIIMNFANPDMVAHTGFLDAAVKAIEAVDKCVGRIVDKLRNRKAITIITADHGNAEEMINQEKQCVMTAHSSSKVPFIICDGSVGSLYAESYENRLCDIAPTILEIIGVEKPLEMTGRSLIKEKGQYFNAK
jgi:2,3-bisphosphoglycerate-independent phosphoglycerate mutase